MTTKICKKCNQEFDLDNFYKSAQHADGKFPWCKTCKRQNYTARGYSETNKKYNRWKKYGITDEQYQSKRLEQNYSCALCLKHETDNHQSKALAVDHDHATGQIRDLLCRECNIALGYFKDDPDLILKAYEYLMRHRNNTVAE